MATKKNTAEKLQELISAKTMETLATPQAEQTKVETPNAKAPKTKESKTPKAKAKKEIKAHKAALDKSRLVFHVKGFAPHVRTAMTEQAQKDGEKHKWDEDKIQSETTNRIFAAAIEKVVNAEGEVDDHQWTADDIQTLMDNAPNGALKEVIAAVVHVTAETLKFDQGVDVPF